MVWDRILRRERSIADKTRGKPVVTENPSEQKSCSLADVPVVETTDFGQLNDLPRLRPLNCSRLRSIAPERQMAP
jgi:hypothetical protein